MPNCVASARISKVSGQPIWSARASCPYSRRLTPDETAFVIERNHSRSVEFGSPGPRHSHGTFAVEAKDLARVKGDFFLGIGDFCFINRHAPLFDQSRDFAVRFL